MQSAIKGAGQGAPARETKAPFKFPNCGWERYQGEQALMCKGYSKDAVHMTIRVLEEMLNYKVVSMGFGRFGGSAILVSNKGRGKKIIEVTENEDGTVMFRFLR